MTEVSKETFFRTIGPLDAHPRNEREHTIWEDQRSRMVVGRSEPGYSNTASAPKRYWLNIPEVRETKTK